MFPVDKAHSWRQVDSSRLKLIGVSAALNSFTGHLGKVRDLGEERLGAGDSTERLVQDIQDVVNYRQETEKFTEMVIGVVYDITRKRVFVLVLTTLILVCYEDK